MGSQYLKADHHDHFDYDVDRNFNNVYAYLY